MDEARQVLDELAGVGLDVEALGEKLQADGVAAFAKSYDDLLATIEKRRKESLPVPAAKDGVVR